MAAARYGQAGELLACERGQVVRVGPPQGVVRTRRNGVRVGGDRPAAGPEGLQLVGGELAEAREARMAREAVERDQPRGVAPGMVGDAGQDLDQLELIVKIVLEPEHRLVARVESRHRAPRRPASRSARIVSAARSPPDPRETRRGRAAPSPGRRAGRGPRGARRASRSPGPPGSSARASATTLSPFVTCTTAHTYATRRAQTWNVRGLPMIVVGSAVKAARSASAASSSVLRRDAFAHHRLARRLDRQQRQRLGVARRMDALQHDQIRVRDAGLEEEVVELAGPSRDRRRGVRARANTRARRRRARRSGARRTTR